MFLTPFLKNSTLKTFITFAAFMGFYGFAHANTSGSLPWDSSLTTLQNNLTGPVAVAVGTLGFLAAGLTLAFGGDELSGVVKKLLYLVLAISIMILGNKFLAALGLTGALLFQ